MNYRPHQLILHIQLIVLEYFSHWRNQRPQSFCVCPAHFIGLLLQARPEAQQLQHPGTQSLCCLLLLSLQARVQGPSLPAQPNDWPLQPEKPGLKANEQTACGMWSVLVPCIILQCFIHPWREDRSGHKRPPRAVKTKLISHRVRATASLMEKPNYSHLN